MITKIRQPQKSLQPCTNREPFTTVSGWHITPFVDEDGNEYERATKNIDGYVKTQWFKVD